MENNSNTTISDNNSNSTNIDEQTPVTLEAINTNIVVLNNNIVMFGTALLFILGIIVGVIVGKVVTLWKR